MPTMPEPTADRPAIPREYGVASGPEGMLPWASVEAQLAAAKLFWVATTTADGRPRVRPVDGTWFEGAIYVGGSPETAWIRDLLANPNVSVHLDSTDGIVIVEGVAESRGRRDLGRRRRTTGGSARRALPVRPPEGRGSRGAGLDRDSAEDDRGVARLRQGPDALPVRLTTRQRRFRANTGIWRVVFRW